MCRPAGTRSLLPPAAPHPAIVSLSSKIAANPGEKPGFSRLPSPALLRRVRRALLSPQRRRFPARSRRGTALQPPPKQMLPDEERGGGLPVRLLIIDLRDAGIDIARFFLVSLRYAPELSSAVAEQSQLLRAFPAVPIASDRASSLPFLAVNSAPFRFCRGRFLIVERRFARRSAAQRSVWRRFAK